MSESTAISAQDTDIAIEGTPGSDITITGVSKAALAVVTGTHSLAIGDEVQFGVVTGMPELRGVLALVTAISTTVSFTVNIDSSNFATVGTGGTAAKKNWTLIGNVKDFSGFDGSVSELDKTHMKGTAKEYAAGLQDFGNFSVNLDIDDADPGQVLARAAATSRATKAWRMKLPNGKKRLFKAFVKKFNETGGTDSIHKGSIDLRITGAVNYC